MKVCVCFYSLAGHVYALAERAVKGIEEAGAEAYLCRVPETLSLEVVKKMKGDEFAKSISHIPVCTLDDLASADAVMFGTPTRFGNMCGQMRQFFDSTGKLWAKKALVGKIGSVFTSTASQHGGQESTILSFHITLLHHGMIVVGLPYIYKGQNSIDEMNGCSPYGASTIAGNKGERKPSEIELSGAEFQGKYVAMLAEKLYKSRENIIEQLIKKQE